MADADEPAFFDFQATEKSGSPRTLANYRDALAAYRKWRGEGFVTWRDEQPDDFRDYLWDPLESTCRHASLSIL